MDNKYTDLIERSISDLWTLAIQYAPKLFLAILTLIIGLWLIKKLNKSFRKVMDKRDMEESLKTFMNSLVSVIFKALLLISVASMLGIETTSFIAILGAAGLAIGLALQGSLANFAGGVLILLFKPFKVDDFIEAQGYKGKVKSIQIFNTILLGPDNKSIIIPNGILSNGVITNFTTVGTIRVDRNFGISYSANMQEARDAVLAILKDHPLILKEPAPQVLVSELGASSVDLIARCHTNVEDWWDVHFYVIEAIKNALDAQKIEIPFPQRVVHMVG